MALITFATKFQDKGQEEHPGFAETCWRWNTPEECSRCYAKKCTRIFKGCGPAWERNHALTDSELVKGITHYCTAYEPYYFRVNISGELTPGRFKAWVKIAKACPKTGFWGFTKETWVIGKVQPDNLFIQPNLLGKNYGKLSWCETMIAENPTLYYLCPCYADKKACSRTCFACMIKQDKTAIFVEH